MLLWPLHYCELRNVCTFLSFCAIVNATTKQLESCIRLTTLDYTHVVNSWELYQHVTMQVSHLSMVWKSLVSCS